MSQTWKFWALYHRLSFGPVDFNNRSSAFVAFWGCDMCDHGSKILPKEKVFCLAGLARCKGQPFYFERMGNIPEAVLHVSSRPQVMHSAILIIPIKNEYTLVNTMLICKRQSNISSLWKKKKTRNRCSCTKWSSECYRWGVKWGVQLRQPQIIW